MLAAPAIAQTMERYQSASIADKEGNSLPYRILFPEDYDKTKKYPLILFLHGAGERGDDNMKQLTHGGNLFLEDSFRKAFPAIVVFPQCPEDKYWINISIREELFGNGNPDFHQSLAPPTPELLLTQQLVDQVIRTEAVDVNRLYVMGLSMGSFGTFEILGRWPERYAAAVAICGGGNLEMAKNYSKTTAVWITHGAQDDVVPYVLSERVYQVLKEQEAEVRFTLFPEANHNAWDPTFELPGLMQWLFSHSKTTEL